MQNWLPEIRIKFGKEVSGRGEEGDKANDHKDNYHYHCHHHHEDNHDYHQGKIIIIIIIR